MTVKNVQLLSFNGWFEWLIIIGDESASWSKVWSSCQTPTDDLILKDFRAVPANWREVTA